MQLFYRRNAEKTLIKIILFESQITFYNFNTYDVENKIVLVRVHSTLIGFILTQLIKKDQISLWVFMKEF